MAKQKKTNGIVKRKVGRPTKLDDDAIAKLESVFKLGVTIETACRYAKIDQSNFHRRKQNDPDFASRMASAQEYARLAAGNVVMDAIVKDKDVTTARWWLEKKHPEEFKSDRSMVNVQGEKVLVMPSDLMGRYAINQTTPSAKESGEKSGKV